MSPSENRIFKMNKENSGEVLSDDVFSLRNLIGKKVRIQTVENKTSEGVVYVIDPIYKTVVISENAKKIHVFMYLSIKSLEVLSEDVVEESFLREPESKDIGDWKNVGKRKETLHNWLKHNMLIDVKIENDFLNIGGNLLIGPPYTQETCYCDNTVVLENVRNIISKMPIDFE